MAANLQAATCSAKLTGQMVNIACGDRTSLNQLLGLVAEETGTKMDPEYLPTRAGDVRDSLADIDAARALIGYDPKVKIREGLRRDDRCVPKLHQVARTRDFDPPALRRRGEASRAPLDPRVDEQNDHQDHVRHGDPPDLLPGDGDLERRRGLPGDEVQRRGHAEEHPEERVVAEREEEDSDEEAGEGRGERDAARGARRGSTPGFEPKPIVTGILIET